MSDLFGNHTFHVGFLMTWLNCSVIVVKALIESKGPGLDPDCVFLSKKYLSSILRKQDFCLCKNKDADQLRSNCEADQRLYFGYTDSTTHLLLKSKISSF